ncbi:MAG: recombinase family protein, partial [Promethearchaeota archaeon]
EINKNTHENEEYNQTEIKYDDFYNRNAAIYARVSTSHQKLDGDLDRQIDSLVKYAIYFKD